MIISFNSQDLRDCCASLERAEAAIGSTHARELMAALSDAEAAETAADFVELYKPNATVTGDSVTLVIGTQYRAIFEAIGASLVRNRKTALDWRSVRRLKMMDLSPC